MIILNTFNWKLQDVISNMQKIKDQGFDAIQISPICECKPGNEWWKLYQPLSFKVGNRLGDSYDFEKLCVEANLKGLRVFVDVVLRHVASTDDGLPAPHELCSKSLASFWVDNRSCDPNNRQDIINGGWGLPRLDYNNKNLQDLYYKPFLDYVTEHADGIRLDMGKHFALPEEGGTFWDNVIKQYKERGKFIYAECINTPTHILNAYTRYCSTLTDQYAKMGVGSVRFFESHDTYYHDWSNTDKMDDAQRLWSLRRLCLEHHNVMFFARPFDNLVFSDSLREILTMPDNLA